MLPLDPLTLTRLGAASWLTDLIVARQFSEAVWQQNALMIASMRSLASPDPRRGAASDMPAVRRALIKRHRWRASPLQT